MNRRSLLIRLIVSSVVLLMSVSSIFAQNKEETEVARAVEALRILLVEPNDANLKTLTSKDLTYGHSNGLVEDQKTFIGSLASGKFNFETIEQSEQTIQLIGNAAVVRHVFKATTHDAGKDPGTAHLKVLQVWQKQGGKWILIARQAVKIIS